MPGKDGFETLKEAFLNLKFVNTVFIAFTAYLKQNDNTWLRYIGFDFILIKPIVTSELIGLINWVSSSKKEIIEKRNPYGNLIIAINELQRLRLRSRVLEEKYIKRLISPEVFAELEANPESLNPVIKGIAIGFIDMRGFTQLSNRLQISQISDLLTIFYEYTVSIIKEESGFIDKFIGDEVMWFHQNDTIEENCKQCIKVAGILMGNLKQLNESIKRKLHLKIELKVGIGISCGNAAVGLFGSPTYRIQYSVIGAPVNLASRLCSEAGENEVLIGGEAIEYCEYKTIKRGFRLIKGFDHEVELRSVLLSKRLRKE
ncbi:MAG: hypothetical protein CVU06_02910 [Bacteroidetes bacterium HGW-Bacteroidetes-22]|nr:MAG: hypothetical protein CVU06_02910 [Bacteroidetes bacterium HGW-Bacteroidetes-22]